jgi:hypothetical protein
MRGVSQISPPIRIVLVAAIGLIAAWMLFLRPSGDVETTKPPTAPGVTGLSNAVDGAKDAAAAQEARDKEVQKATGEESGTAAGKPEAAQATTSAKALETGRVLALSPVVDDKVKDLPKGIREALARRDVFAIGVFNTRNKAWAPMAADDRRVRRALRDANRYGGRVTVHSATLRDLTKLRPVIGGVDVTQSPSVVVVDRNRKATVLEGYVDRVSINQAIADARRNTIAFRIKNAYLTDLNDTCAKYFMRIGRTDYPKSRAGVNTFIDRVLRVGRTYQGRFAALKAPTRFKGLKSQVQSALRSDLQRVAAARGAIRRGNWTQALTILDSVNIAAAVALDKRLDSTGVTSCVGFRRS